MTSDQTYLVVESFLVLPALMIWFVKKERGPGGTIDAVQMRLVCLKLP